jgi:hypothetical protein
LHQEHPQKLDRLSSKKYLLDSTSKMSARFSTLVRNGSNISSSSSGYVQLTFLPGTTQLTFDESSAGPSSINLPLSRFRSYTLTTWSTEANHYERLIATGKTRLGIAVLTREMMEMHIQHAPDVRGMFDCLPVAGRDSAMFIGWRKKQPTWPRSKLEEGDNSCA